MWKRPKDATYPAIYSKFEGTKLFDGKRRQYWIQDLTEDYEDAVMKHLDGFLGEESFCKYSKVLDNPKSVKDFAESWTRIMNKRMSLKNENGETEIAGFNITGPAVKNSNSPENVEHKESKMVHDTCKHIAKKTDTYNVIGCNVFLSAIGLYVVPKYRGDGLAVEILKSRRGLCKNVGLKGSGTIFTTLLSQKSAVKAGFTDLVTINYKTLREEDPNLTFPGVTDPAQQIKYMYIKY